MTTHQRIFKNLPFSCLLFEKQGEIFVIKEANKYYCRVTNSNEKELRGKVIGDVFPENPSFLGLKEIEESLQSAFSTQEPHKIDVLRYDLFDRHNDNYEIRFWEIENIPLIDDNGTTEFILNVVKDITAVVLEKEERKDLKEKLDANTEKHEQVLNRITDGLFALDRDGNFLSLNQGLVDISETPEAELLKMNFLPFCGQEHREKIVKNFSAAIGGKNQKFEANFVSGKGREKVLEISLVPLKNDAIICGIYGIAKDITKLKSSENALLQSERKFKALVQEGSDLIGILDLEGKYKFVSETSLPVLGIAPEEFIGRTAFEYIHPEDKERVLKEFSELEVKHQIQINPFRFKNASGEWRWIEAKAINLINDTSVGGIVTNSRDITDQLNSQKAIKESEERYRSFFENSLDAIMVTIPTGEILAANPSACKMFQRTEEELCLLGRNAVTYPNDSRLEKALKLRRETGTATLELTFLRKDGTKFPGEITSSTFEDADGNSRNSMIIRDITERKNAENKLLELNNNLEEYTKELIKANKGLEQYSYIISHNLRAPVANILGLAELLNDVDYSEEIRENLRKEIHTNAQRMDNVINDLNQILQMKHDFSEAKKIIDLNDIVFSIETRLQDLIKNENISLSSDFTELDKIKSVGSFIYSIFYNLIINSIKFRQPGLDAVLNIRSEKDNGVVRFIFKDNGLGVDLEKRKDEIFGLYKRFHYHVEGKGMGLFLVRSQVEMLGGKITMLSKENSGSTFIIEFKNEILVP